MNESYGFIREKLDIKILILFVLKRLPEPVELGTLAEQTLCDGGINYFDFTECTAELVKSGHIIEDGGKYGITDKGLNVCNETESSLPLSVRLKAEKSTAILSRILKRSSQISARHEFRRKGGLGVFLSMSDGDLPVINLELTVENEADALKMEKSFKENAESIYIEILSRLLNQADGS